MTVTTQTKSDRTRATILKAARAIFARQGYERTTIRDIAAAAAIDPAMVIRYFHSKEELFALIAEFDLRLPNPADIDPNRIGEALVTHFLDIWEGEQAVTGLAVMIRSAASNEFAARKVHEVFSGQVLPMLTSIGDPGDARDRAGLVASQLIGLAFGRYVVKLAPVVGLSRDRIIRDIGATIQAYLTPARDGAG
ncbi:MAG: TetR family transcriptional regulator [Rhizobium sp.]|nr:TetR family transcriptional regulator [Rhizobium sp.]